MNIQDEMSKRKIEISAYKESWLMKWLNSYNNCAVPAALLT